MSVAKLLEPRNIKTHKQGFKDHSTTYQTTVTLINNS